MGEIVQVDGAKLTRRELVLEGNFGLDEGNSGAQKLGMTEGVVEQEDRSSLLHELCTRLHIGTEAGVDDLVGDTKLLGLNGTIHAAMAFVPQVQCYLACTNDAARRRAARPLEHLEIDERDVGARPCEPTAIRLGRVNEKRRL